MPIAVVDDMAREDSIAFAMDQLSMFLRGPFQDGAYVDGDPELNGLRVLVVADHLAKDWGTTLDALVVESARRLVAKREAMKQEERT